MTAAPSQPKPAVESAAVAAQPQRSMIMTPIYRLASLALAAAALSLAACGGGGATQTAAAPAPTAVPAASQSDAPAQSEAPAPAPAPAEVSNTPDPHTDTVNALDAIAARATGWVWGNRIGAGIGERDLWSELRRPQQRNLATLGGIAAQYATLPARNSVSMANEELTNAHSVAGWLEQSFFVLSQTTGADPATVYYSAGAHAPREPAAGLTWTGAAVAVDLTTWPAQSSTYRRVFYGDVELSTTALSTNDHKTGEDVGLSISISGLTRHGGTETLPDVTGAATIEERHENAVWGPHFIASGSGGSQAGDVSAGINGWFYGPNAEEVGGVFNVHVWTGNDIVPRYAGAFGAKR